MSNLQPLKWQKGAALGTFETVHELVHYTIRPDIDDPNKYRANLGNGDHKTLNSVEDAKQWIETDYYPHKMQPYVKPSPTWIDYEAEKPKDGDNIVITWLWMGDRHTVHLNDYSAEKSNYLDDCPEVYWSLSPFISTMQNLHKGEVM